jgi:two-component system, sensor histidine kinase LadS
MKAAATFFRGGIVLAVLGMALTGVTAARASEPVSLGDNRVMRPLTSNTDILAEDGTALSIDEVSSPSRSGRFLPMNGDALLINRDLPSVWLRFRFADAPVGVQGRDTGWFLEVRPSFSIVLDVLDLYLPSENRAAEPFSGIFTGAMRPAQAGDIPSRFFLFSLPRGAVSGNYCYLHLASGMDVSVELNAWPALALRDRDILNFAGFGIIFGILLSMFFYNLFVYIALKDRPYLYYILYIGSALVWLFHVQGHTKMFLGQHPAWDLMLLWVSVSFTLLWGVVFTISFLGVKKNLPRMYLILAAMSVISAASIGMGLLGMNKAAFVTTHLGGVVMPVVVIATAAMRLRQNYIPSRFFLLAWSTLAAGGLVFALMGLKVLPVNYWTINGVAIGVTMESLLLSLALADRIRLLRKEKEYYEKTQKRYFELSVTDGLTGLYNKRYLQSKLRSEVEHAASMELPLSLILLDLDDFKSVNDEHGHSFGDSVLAALAVTLNNCTREGDIVCRFGGEEFVVIMPGTRNESACITAERIRTGFSDGPIKTAGGKSVTVTISAGVAELRSGEDAASLLDRADNAMYEAKRRGKNRISMT